MASFLARRRLSTASGADVVIVGAGIMGLNIAYQLKRRAPSMSVTVLERAPAVGADFAPDGTLWLLRRRFELLGGFSFAIWRHVPQGDGFGPGERMLDLPFGDAADNAEGLAVWVTPAGRTRTAATAGTGNTSRVSPAQRTRSLRCCPRPKPCQLFTNAMPPTSRTTGCRSRSLPPLPPSSPLWSDDKDDKDDKDDDDKEEVEARLSSSRRVLL